jgi:4-hydroxybenzoate polyprenyltransferase
VPTTDWPEKENSNMNRWWIYQNERFPLAAHVPLIGSFSFCAVAYSARLRVDQWPTIDTIAVAFVCCLIFFMQLRIADEFKDNEEDTKYRPYRPVPRGLVKLKELAIIFIVGALLQFGLAMWFQPKLLIVLVIAWLYLGSMSFEFGVREWLKSRPVVYLFSHMLIMPIVDFYATACDWIFHHNFPPSGIAFFLIASFFNGLVIELGRKIRAPHDEEEGVETYSSLWGPKIAVWLWFTTLILTATFAIFAAHQVHVGVQVSILYLFALILLCLLCYKFYKNPDTNTSKKIELSAGIWTLILYGSLGLIPGIL